jgi:ferric-dicitrate binding protein FerR (iron transport regulator)
MARQITKEDIIAFFEDRSSMEDAAGIYRYLLEHPEEVGKFFPEEEWTRLQESEYLPADRVHAAWPQRIWNNIQRQKEPSQRRIGSWQRIAIAAAVVIAVAGIFLLTVRSQRRQRPASGLATITFPARHRDTTLTNTTRNIEVITLDDGSVVELSPAGTLQFSPGFAPDKRPIRLTGEALFTVAADQRRPFTVYANGFSTTALGTVFRIKAYAGSNLSIVHLLHGKVAVRNLKRPAQVEYLLAGQECTFDVVQYALRKVVPHSAAAGGPDIDLLSDGSYAETEEEINFKNLPLPRVLAVLSQSYHKPIRFDSRELSKRKFTGSVDKGTPLDIALNSLASLNDLVVSRQDSSFCISIRK